jgi:hypothetical protein
MAGEGWYPDPSGKHEQRYYDGTQWTEHVSNGGVTAVDPVPTGPPTMSTTAAMPVAPATPTPAGGPSPATSRRWVPWVVGLVAVAVIAVVAVALTSGDDDGDDTVEAVTTTSREEEDEADTTTIPTTEAPPDTEAPTTTQAGGGAGSRDNPAPLGTEQSLGDWKVTVVSFTGDGTAQVMADNSFNEPPTNGTYALVRVRATYVGTETGSPSFAFTVGYLGSDAIFYEQCNAVEPDPLFLQPDVSTGGTVEGNVCIDMPPAVLGTGAIYVEEIFSFEDEQRWWLEQ